MSYLSPQWATWVNLVDLCSRLKDLESSPSKERTSLQERNEKVEGTEFDPEYREKIPRKFRPQHAHDLSTKFLNVYFKRYIENTSDELSKRFSFRCVFAPDTCSKVVESYGSEHKAFREIKDHIVQFHLIKDSVTDIKKKKIVTSSADRPVGHSSKFLSECSAETPKTNFEEGLNRGRSVSQERAEKEIVAQGLLSFSDAVNVAYLKAANNLKLGESEHDYCKIIEQQDAAILPVHEPGKNKNQRIKIDAAHNKFILNHLSKRMNGDSYTMPPVVTTAPFPFVYVPQPLEPALIVELNSDGNPVNGIESTFLESSADRISSKKAVENKIIRKKAKFSHTVNKCRSVLECVENRVTSKPSVSSVSTDALVASASIENSENASESIYIVARRNILLLNQQKRKRKCPNKISDYICQICKKKLTAITSLTYHYLGHLKIKPFKCEVCSRRFTRRHSLKYHMMIHDNTNRFQCTTCKRMFRHPSHYKEHLRKHTGEEPYPCKFCSNKFKTRNSFKRHLKMQHQKNLTSNGIVPISNDS